jgi:hypothetical protein
MPVLGEILRPSMNIPIDIFPPLHQIGQSPKPQAHQFLIDGVEVTEGGDMGDLMPEPDHIPLKRTLSRNHPAKPMGLGETVNLYLIQPSSHRLETGLNRMFHKILEKRRE